MNSIIHPIEPVYNENSKILILGSFPSVKSREQGFFYGHPQNRFWRVLAGVFGCETPVTIDDKKAFLIENNVALWDVIHSCEIEGSADSSIKNVVVNNIDEIVSKTAITKIITNGRKADELYNKYIKADIECVCLPSTSPANAAWSLERLIDFWSKELIIPPSIRDTSLY
jgi:hypoxanthine-DNA glycosylase